PYVLSNVAVPSDVRCARQVWAGLSRPCCSACDDAFAVVETQLPNALLPFLPVPKNCANVLPPCEAAKFVSACSAWHVLLALVALFCSSGANRETQAPKLEYAWSNAVAPIFACSAVQSLLAELWSLVLASAAVGAMAAAST